MDTKGFIHLHRRYCADSHRYDDCESANDDSWNLHSCAFIVVNSWISGHGDVEVQRTLSADNLYKGDDLYVELLVTNRSNRNTQLLEVYDNIPHEMKLRSGLNQMRLNLRPGESARIRYVLRCPLRGHYSIGPVSLRSRNTFNLGVEEMYVDHHSRHRDLPANQRS